MMGVIGPNLAEKTRVQKPASPEISVWAMDRAARIKSFWKKAKKRPWQSDV